MEQKIINGDQDKKIYVTFHENIGVVYVGLSWDLGRGNEWYLDAEGKRLERQLLNSALYKAMTPYFKDEFCSNLSGLFTHMKRSPTVCII